MENLLGKTAVLYRRVSTTDQKTYGNSLNAQRDELIAFCDKYGLSILFEFEEDFSAKDFNRPVYGQMLSFAKTNKNKIDYLLVVNWDRFSRNVYEALKEINQFSKLGIEVNAVNNWVDYKDPNQQLIHLIHLGIPEVDNRIRSQKVKMGMRQAMKEGRWINKQPKGFLAGRDDYGKPLMKPNPVIAPLISEMFELFATGQYSQNELIKLHQFKELRLSKSNVSRMLTQIAYAGKITVSKNGKEKEEIVDGLHEPIVSIETFYKVQSQILRRKRYKHKPNVINEMLPLRGFLQCPKCGQNLTGSGSKSKTGKKHYYYHCNPRAGCNVRFKVAVIHKSLEQMFSKLSPNKEIVELFRIILEDRFNETEESNLRQLQNIKFKLKVFEEKKETLVEKLLNEVISDATYKVVSLKIDKEINELILLKSQLEQEDNGLKKFMDFGLSLLLNLNQVFEQSPVHLKQKILSSILDKKMVFEDGHYRTPKFKPAFGYIYRNISDFESKFIKKGDSLETLSRKVPGVGLEPTRP